MTETLQTSHGPFVPTTTLVQCDQVSILGDGSRENPLRAVPGGVSVTTDGITILGSGTQARPLHSGSVPVTADGTTILGNGTTGSPLRAGPGRGTFRAAFRGGSAVAVPGQPVFVGSASAPGGITTVQPASATNGLGGSQVDGVVSAVNGDGTVQIQTSGVLTLTTAQWDAITGGSGGLALGTTYYLDVFPSSGITGTAPATPAVFVSQVGVGLSATTMLVQLGEARQNLGDLTFLAKFGGVPLLGSAVRVDGNDHVVEATSSISLAASQCVGIVVALDVVNGTRAVVQIAGKAVLTTAQWDAITDTAPGMVAGTAYYVDTAANPGHLTAIKPAVGAASQVGIGLDATTLLLSTPCFPLRLT
jgi:hypothetical protein